MESDQFNYAVSPAMLAAWLRYRVISRDYDVSAGEYLPLQGHDLPRLAAQGLVEALRQLCAAGDIQQDEPLHDCWGNEYRFNLKTPVPLGDSLLHPCTAIQTLAVDVMGAGVINVALAAKIPGTHRGEPYALRLDSYPDVEDLLNSVEWAAILTACPAASRLRLFNFNGSCETRLSLSGAPWHLWYIHQAEVHDLYPSERRRRWVLDTIADYLSVPSNRERSATAAAALRRRQ